MWSLDAEPHIWKTDYNLYADLTARRVDATNPRAIQGSTVYTYIHIYMYELINFLKKTKQNKTTSSFT